MNKIDMLQLQRCVDGELSDKEQHELLQQLEARNEWRSLALSFVESRLLAGAFDDVPHSAPVQRAPAPLPRPGRRWIQSLSSIAAALVVGVGTGVAVHQTLRQNPGAPAGAPALAAIETNPAPAVAHAIPQTPQSSSSATPMVNVHMVGLNSSGGKPVSVPVYTPEEWEAMPYGDDGSLLPEDVLKELEAQGYIVDRERSWYRATLEDGREVLVPTERVKLRHAVQ